MAELILGCNHPYSSGNITYNNDFDTSQVKRIYRVENHSLEFFCAWQGHKIEQRWLNAMRDAFEIRVIKVDDFENPSKDLKIEKFKLNGDKLNYLAVPAGCITAIKSLEECSEHLT